MRKRPACGARVRPRGQRRGYPPCVVRTAERLQWVALRCRVLQRVELQHGVLVEEARRRKEKTPAPSVQTAALLHERHGRRGLRAGNVSVGMP